MYARRHRKLGKRDLRHDPGGSVCIEVNVLLGGLAAILSSPLSDKARGVNGGDEDDFGGGDLGTRRLVPLLGSSKLEDHMLSWQEVADPAEGHADFKLGVVEPRAELRFDRRQFLVCKLKITH